MNQTIPTKKLEIKQDQTSLLDQIKNIRLTGRNNADRGTPNHVEMKDIVQYINKNGRTISNGPLELETLPDYMNELFEENGTLGREVTGQIYWLQTTNPNQSMSDPTSGNSTTFQYRNNENGTEDLFFDAMPIASTGWLNDTKLEKIPENSNLRKIISAINPDSKLI